MDEDTIELFKKEPPTFILVKRKLRLMNIL
jgi:hypothetical protein